MAFIAIMAGKERTVPLQHDEIYDEEGWRRQNLESAEKPEQS